MTRAWAFSGWTGPEPVDVEPVASAATPFEQVQHAEIERCRSASWRRLRRRACLARTLSLGPPTKLFEGAYLRIGTVPSYDVSSDGQSFLMIQQPSAATSSVVIVENWFEELKRLVPTN